MKAGGRGDKPQPAYRPCVGVALFNSDGLVFLGRRAAAPEEGGFDHPWQMPQGGIDPGEKPIEAARRELLEETGICSVSLLGEAADWLCYDVPAALAGQAWKGRYRGQSQKWFAFRFTGDEAEIDLGAAAGGKHEPEFDAWRWERLDLVPQLVVPFKREVYERVAAAFSHFAGPADTSETLASGGRPRS